MQIDLHTHTNASDGVLESETLVKKATDPIDDFLSLRRKLPKISDKKILAAIRNGRM